MPIKNCSNFSYIITRLHLAVRRELMMLDFLFPQPSTVQHFNNDSRWLKYFAWVVRDVQLSRTEMWSLSVNSFAQSALQHNLSLSLSQAASAWTEDTCGSYEVYQVANCIMIVKNANSLWTVSKLPLQRSLMLAIAPRYAFQSSFHNRDFSKILIYLLVCTLPIWGI